MQTVATGLTTRLRARAHSVYSRWRKQRTFELLSLAAHAKTFMVESALIRRIRGKLTYIHSVLELQP